MDNKDGVPFRTVPPSFPPFNFIKAKQPPSALPLGTNVFTTQNHRITPHYPALPCITHDTWSTLPLRIDVTRWEEYHGGHVECCLDGLNL